MKFKLIRELKAKYEGLTIETYQTHMYSNTEWASVWKIKFMGEQDMKDLLKYLDNNNLIYFFGRSGIHIQ